MKIEVRVESKRGCGWRKPGGLYLVSGGLSAPCGKLPIPLDVCPTCGSGIKPSRGWTWIAARVLVAEKPCVFEGQDARDGGPNCGSCVFAGMIADPHYYDAPERVGLLWIGEKFYSRPENFTREAAQMGVSRRIHAIPRDFELGETWVWFAHRKVIENEDGSFTAAVFHAFRPTAIEYVVKGDEKQDELERLEERGITLVKIKRANLTGALPFQPEREESPTERCSRCGQDAESQICDQCDGEGELDGNLCEVCKGGGFVEHSCAGYE